MALRHYVADCVLACLFFPGPGELDEVEGDGGPDDGSIVDAIGFIWGGGNNAHVASFSCTQGSKAIADGLIPTRFLSSAVSGGREGGEEEGKRRG